MVTYIPSTAETIAPEEKPVTKVAAYARVSTLNPEQEDSYEAQKEHYETLISETEGWELAEIYADQASGLNTKKRTDFKRMMADAKKGKFNLLLVKSISRFARNLVDSISSIRELQSYGIEVRFQKESLSTASPQIGFLLAVMSSMAEQESLSISQNVQLSFEYKMKRGEWFCTYSKFLGYDKDKDGEIVINPEQAETVRLIYDRFLSGTSLDHLAKQLKAEGRKTGTGGTSWNKGHLAQIIKNEKYSGIAILQKTFTDDVLNKHRKVNNGDRPQYRVENALPAIIDKQTWLLAQAELLRRAKAAKEKTIPGPRPRWGKNDFSSMVYCPHCGAFLNRHLARQTRVWKCHNRATGNGCNCEIIHESELQEATLKAAQALWDKKPNIRHFKVPTLTDKTSEKVQIEAAATFAENQYADRITTFLSQPRPEEYSSEMPLRLLDRIDFSDTEWTFRFWGRQTIKVPRTAGANKDLGRKLKRSNRPEPKPTKEIVLTPKRTSEQSGAETAGSEAS